MTSTRAERTPELSKQYKSNAKCCSAGLGTVLTNVGRILRHSATTNPSFSRH